MPLNKEIKHTHTHIYMCVCVCVFNFLLYILQVLYLSIFVENIPEVLSD